MASHVSDRLGSTVLDGPFKGMRLVPGFEERAASPVLKLLGSYEQQLHQPIEAAIDLQPRMIANLGSADGYYAAGLALRIRGAIVHAYDLASTAREMTTETALINGVSGRVVVHRRCRHFPDDLELLVCDIEGAEAELVNGEVLAHAMIIVETHDHAVPRVTEVLIERFAASHHVDVLGSMAAEKTNLLDWLSDSEVEIALDEMRGGAEQRWLVMRPRVRATP